PLRALIVSMPPRNAVGASLCPYRWADLRRIGIRFPPSHLRSGRIRVRKTTQFLVSGRESRGGGAFAASRADSRAVNRPVGVGDGRCIPRLPSPFRCPQARAAVSLLFSQTRPSALDSRRGGS